MQNRIYNSTSTSTVRYHHGGTYNCINVKCMQSSSNHLQGCSLYGGTWYSYNSRILETVCIFCVLLTPPALPLLPPPFLARWQLSPGTTRRWRWSPQQCLCRTRLCRCRGCSFGFRLFASPFPEKTSETVSRGRCGAVSCITLSKSAVLM